MHKHPYVPEDKSARREERRQFLRALSGGVALVGLGMLEPACHDGQSRCSRRSGSPSGVELKLVQLQFVQL